MSAQTVYNLVPAVGNVGQVADSANSLITSFPAGEAIEAGRLCEVVNGVLRKCQTAGANLGKVVGVSCYSDAREPGTWAVGDMVPCLRKGRVFAAFSGTTQVEWAVPNVKHPSVTEQGVRGAFTDTATSAVADSEIAVAPAGVLLLEPTGVAGMCLVEMNLP